MTRIVQFWSFDPIRHQPLLASLPWSSSFGEATAGDGGGFFISLRRSCWSSTATVWRGVKNRGEINGKIKGGAQLMGRLLFCRRFIVQKIWAPLFCHGFIVPAFPVPLLICSSAFLGARFSRLPALALPVRPGPAADYSFFFAPPSLLPSLPSSFEESLNSLTPRPRPRISSGIFLPPNRSNTTNRISMSSVGPRNRGMMDNVMVYSGLWCVRFPSGLPLPYSRTRGLPADKCTKNFRNPAFPGEKKRTWLRIPIPNRGNPRVSTPGRQPAFCGSGTGAS